MWVQSNDSQGNEGYINSDTISIISAWPGAITMAYVGTTLYQISAADAAAITGINPFPVQQ